MPQTKSTILTVNKAEYKGGFLIAVTFNNGKDMLLDFSDIVKSGKGVCSKLADINYFKSFTLDPFTIDWNNEVGFAPEYLYNMGKEIKKL